MCSYRSFTSPCSAASSSPDKSVCSTAKASCCLADLKFTEIKMWIQRLIYVLKLDGYWKIVTKHLSKFCQICWPICARYFSTFDCHIDIFAVFVGTIRFFFTIAVVNGHYPKIRNNNSIRNQNVIVIWHLGINQCKSSFE